VHQFYQDRGFIYVHTPIITTSDCEGAGEMFRVTTLDLQKVPEIDGHVDYSQDFFKDEASLTVSGQLEAEIFALSHTNCYTFGPTFRSENSNTSRHLSEFWMIEPEMAFCDLSGDMELADEFVKYVIADVLEHCAEDIAFLKEREWVDYNLIDTLEGVVNTKCEVLEYTEAIRVLEASGANFEFPVKWGMDLQAEHERYLTDVHVKGPTFVINYPKEIKAFYMRMNEDNKTVAAMDLLVPGLGEIIGGSQREERGDVLETRMADSGIEKESLWWYLELRKYGSVPHAGFGLGFERLMMYLTGIQNIRDVIPFPRHPGYAQF
jgi:asparaginyl-tRNA synthetase